MAKCIAHALGLHDGTQAESRTDVDYVGSIFPLRVHDGSQYGRYGYRRVPAQLRQAGWRVNAKRVERIRRRDGLAKLEVEALFIEPPAARRRTATVNPSMGSSVTNFSTARYSTQ